MAESPSDATLLERFVEGREEAAFAALVARHGPRVRAACRRILRNEHDAEDAAQATFLVLAGRASGIAWQESMGRWLHAVASRQALHTRADAARRARREISAGAFDANEAISAVRDLGLDPSAEIDRRELRRVVLEELDQLPEPYRQTLELCDLEGLTHQEAARRLGWPSGSISRRIGRARALLRERLIERGLLLTLIALIGLGGLSRVARLVPEAPRSSLPVREAMAPFRSPERGGRGLGEKLARVARSNTPPADPADLLELALASARSARWIAEVDPGRGGLAWNALAVEMRDASLLLARAALDDDSLGAFEAARRLDASCLRCHDHYRR